MGVPRPEPALCPSPAGPPPAVLGPAGSAPTLLLLGREARQPVPPGPSREAGAGGLRSPPQPGPRRTAGRKPPSQENFYLQLVAAEYTYKENLKHISLYPISPEFGNYLYHLLPSRVKNGPHHSDDF
nr:protein diaphanous-like [Chlorocebus sabaeus]